MTKVFTAAAVAAAILTARSGGAQTAAQNGVTGSCSSISCDIQKDWLRNGFLLYGVADAMPEDKFGFKPTPAQQTFGERVLHSASTDISLLMTLGAKTPPPAIDMKATAKAGVLAALRQSGEYGTAVLKEFSDQQLAERVASPWFMGPMSSRQRIVYFLMTHSQDVYGQLAVYLRLNGITPPLSRQP